MTGRTLSTVPGFWCQYLPDPIQISVLAYNLFTAQCTFFNCSELNWNSVRHLRVNSVKTWIQHVTNVSYEVGPFTLIDIRIQALSAISIWLSGQCQIPSYLAGANAWKGFQSIPINNEAKSLLL